MHAPDCDCEACSHVHHPTDEETLARLRQRRETVRRKIYELETSTAPRRGLQPLDERMLARYVAESFGISRRIEAIRERLGLTTPADVWASTREPHHDHRPRVGVGTGD